MNVYLRNLNLLFIDFKNEQIFSLKHKQIRLREIFKRLIIIHLSFGIWRVIKHLKITQIIAIFFKFYSYIFFYK